MNFLTTKHVIQPPVAWGIIAVTGAAVLAMAVNLQVGFFALFFALVAWWTWQHEELSLLFFIALAPILPMFKVTQTLGTFTLVKDVVILSLFIKVFAWPLVRQTLPYRRNILALPLAGILLWCAVGLLMADSVTLGILRARDIGLYILLYIAALYMNTTPRIMKTRLLWFLGSASVLLLAGIYQMGWAADSAVLRFDPARSIWIPRMSSTFAHPTVFGEYLVLLTSVCAAFALNSKKYRWWAVVLSVVLMPFIYLTYSRGVWLGYLCSLLAIAVAYGMGRASIPGKRMLVWVGGSLGVMIMVLSLLYVFTPVGTFLRSSLDPTYASNKIRLDFVARLLGNTNNRQALFGHGLGDINQKVAVSAEVGAGDITSGDARDVQLAKDSTLVDNQYLKTFIELGLVGVLLYGWLYVRVLRLSSTQPSLLSLAAFGFFASFIVEALFVDIWDVFPTNAMFWVVAAMVSQLRIDKRPA